jgi:hypothetical protein
MPYTNPAGGFEHASALGHVPTVQHPHVRKTHARYRMPSDRTQDTGAIADRLVDPATLPQDAADVRWTVATDSSPFEHEVDPAFPATRILFMQMSAVIVDLERLSTRSGPFADPAAIQDAQRASVLAGALPSSNLVRVDETPPKTAFRQEVNALFRESEVEGRSLLDVFFEVEANRDPLPVAAGTIELSRCPTDGCDADLARLGVGPGGAVCPKCNAELMATDALRAHEIFNDQGSNLEACSRVMSVAERFISLALLDQLLDQRPSALARMAFVTDGPLALFGEVAPIKRPLLRRLQTIADDLRSRDLGIPVVVGIEKSGAFWDHAQAIRDHVPEGNLMLLDEDYIERYITFKGAAVHGRDTYYGRHFFYRAQGGQIYVITVPPLGRVGAERHGALDLDDYPTLRATCSVLDAIGTRLYDDATIPITLAHKYAAYPLTTAGQVLKLHAEEHLDRAMAA